MTAGRWFEDTPESRRLDAEEGLVIDVTEAIAGAMQEVGVSRQELGRRIETSPVVLRAVLHGDAEPSVRMVARMLHAVGYRLEVKAVRVDGDRS